MNGGMCLNQDAIKIEMLKQRYKPGTRVCLERMDGEPQMPAGLKGEVFLVDDIGQIHVQWENGSSLALNAQVDQFCKIGTPMKKREKGEPFR